MLFLVVQAPIVQRVDNAIHQILPVDSQVSGGYRYPPFEQLGPGGLALHVYEP